METNPQPPTNTRIGFQYYPDTQHYREQDLNLWVPELLTLGACWITLDAPADHAIPEIFIQGLIRAKITPILRFNFSISSSLTASDMQLLFETYARWGVNYVVLFDRPNLRSNWSSKAWGQDNLVERFLDIYLPLAEAAIQAGLTPVFPPLEPGGDYWDVAFLRGALQGIQRRGNTAMLSKLTLGAYAWASNRSLDWGAGGPERWPLACPYHTSLKTEDQLGFRIFDWYLTIARAVLRCTCPIILLGGGSKLGDNLDDRSPAITPFTHAQRNLVIARLMSGEESELEPVPLEVLACTFWLLTASPGSPDASQAWFQSIDLTLPVVEEFRKWYADKMSTPEAAASHSVEQPQFFNSHPIAHYLLLPLFEWGISDWHLEAIRPFVKKFQPTIGFSPTEACLASRVTIVGGIQSFPDMVEEQLIAAGCIVNRVIGDGTSIASQLSAL